MHPRASSCSVGDMKNAEKMRRKFRDYDRLVREIEELEKLIKTTEPGSRSRIALNKGKNALWKDACKVLSDVRKEQEFSVRKNFERHDFKGLRGYGRRFKVRDVDEYVGHTLRMIQSYFSTGYLKGYRQALKDTGQIH